MAWCLAASKLPDWSNVLKWRKAPRVMPDDKEIGKELDSGVLFDPGASSLFRDAPQPGAVVSTPVLAEQRPGEVMAVGLERIRKVLSALHGDAAASEPQSSTSGRRA